MPLNHRIKKNRPHNDCINLQAHLKFTLRLTRATGGSKFDVSSPLKIGDVLSAGMLGNNSSDRSTLDSQYNLNTSRRTWEL